MQDDPIVIVSAKRTPTGNLLGQFATLQAAQLGACAIKAILDETTIDPTLIDEVLMGCVLAAGQGQAPARQAALGAGLPQSCGATTINKMCGSAMKAIMLAHDLLLTGNYDALIAGGMESMSNAPYLLSKARSGYRLGHGEIKDHMFLDGLEDAYDKGRLMGYFAEETVKKYGFTREQQDAFAIRSLERAKAASEAGHFNNEIIPVTVQDKREEKIISNDEGPFTAKIDKIPKLKPAFAKEGSVTPANSSSISDGASAVLLMRESTAKAKGLTVIAKIVAHSSHAQEPAWFTTAPTQAIQKVVNTAKWKIDDVDLFEINEAFAVVTMAAMHDLNLSEDKVNIRGGACALGHPIGASGARILTTLIYALQQSNKKRGIASLCIGGGEATAMAIELA